MAQEGRQDLWTYEAGTGLDNTDEYRFVYVDPTTRVAALPGVANAGKTAFVLVEAHAGVASVVWGGVVKIVLGAALDIGARVTSDADGAAVAVGNDELCGVLLESGDEGEMVAMRVAF